MKYSRAVVYKIDQKKMTVEQIWEVGKDLGYDYFSAGYRNHEVHGRQGHDACLLVNGRYGCIA